MKRYSSHNGRAPFTLGFLLLLFILLPSLALSEVYTSQSLLLPHPSGCTISALQAVDVDHDGAEDIVYTARELGSSNVELHVHFQDPDSQSTLPFEYTRTVPFTSSPALSISPVPVYQDSLVVTDLNRDGRDDVVFSDGSELTVFYQTAVRKFAAPITTPGLADGHAYLIAPFLLETSLGRRNVIMGIGNGDAQDDGVGFFYNAESQPPSLPGAVTPLSKDPNTHSFFRYGKPVSLTSGISALNDIRYMFLASNSGAGFEGAEYMTQSSSGPLNLVQAGGLFGPGNYIIPQSAEMRAIATGNFDQGATQNGEEDELAVAYNAAPGQGVITILQNRGNSPSPSYFTKVLAVIDSPADVKTLHTLDFNFDGLNDLVATYELSGIQTVYLQQSDGTFSQEHMSLPFPTIGGPNISDTLLLKGRQEFVTIDPLSGIVMIQNNNSLPQFEVLVNGEIGKTVVTSDEPVTISARLTVTDPKMDGQLADLEFSIGLPERKRRPSRTKVRLYFNPNLSTKFSLSPIQRQTRLGSGEVVLLSEYTGLRKGVWEIRVRMDGNLWNGTGGDNYLAQGLEQVFYLRVK